MTELAGTCAQEGGVPTDAFVELLEMIVNLLQTMGSMMSMAFSGKFPPHRTKMLCNTLASPTAKVGWSDTASDDVM